MITILPIERLEEMNPYIEESLFARNGQNGYFFVALGEKKYWLKFQNIDGDLVILYADKDHFILATDSSTMREAAERINSPDDGILQLYEFFLEISANDVFQLEAMENSVVDLEDRLLTEKKPGAEWNSRILTIRKQLIKMKRYYVEMEFLTDELSAIDDSFLLIDRKFDRLLNFVLHLQEYIEQVQEAHQAQIDYEQNNLMKIFTVVTSIFLPLTLITGWYGMNLKMPEFNWAMGYPFVIGVSVVVVLGLIAYFKHKKWF
ncbi:magnesium transporter [Clostridiales Family XIII bacterium PM5-7]